MSSVTPVLMMMSLLVATMSFASATETAGATIDSPLLGGVTAANVTDIGVKAAAVFAIKTLNQAGQNSLRSKLVGVPAGLLVQTGIKSATKQVVAGTMYGLLVTGQ